MRNNDLQNTIQKTEDRATQTPLKTNSDLQNTTHKTEDRATQTPLKTNFIDCIALWFEGKEKPKINEMKKKQNKCSIIRQYLWGLE